MKAPHAATPTPSSIRGKVVVLGIFGVAILLAAFAWWWNLRQNGRASQLWGRDNIRLMRLAKQVELWELAPADAPTISSSERVERLIVDGTPYQILSRRNISQARGLVHARHALTEDASYDWTQPGGSAGSDNTDSWRLAVRFQEDEQTATLLIDPTSHRVRLLEGKREATAISRILAGWEKLAERENATKRSP